MAETGPFYNGKVDKKNPLVIPKGQARKVRSWHRQQQVAAQQQPPPPGRIIDFSYHDTAPAAQPPSPLPERTSPPAPERRSGWRIWEKLGIGGRRRDRRPQTRGPLLPQIPDRPPGSAGPQRPNPPHAETRPPQRGAPPPYRTEGPGPSLSQPPLPGDQHPYPSGYGEPPIPQPSPGPEPAPVPFGGPHTAGHPDHAVIDPAPIDPPPLDPELAAILEELQRAEHAPSPDYRQPPFEANRIYRLEELFRAIHGEPNSHTNREYFTPRVSRNTLRITNDNFERFTRDAVRRPFLLVTEVNDQGQAVRFMANPDVAPYAYTRESRHSHEPQNTDDVRFRNAEDATRGDSGVFALAASSAELPREQAELYKRYVRAILDTHLHGSYNGRNILQEWMAAQQNTDEAASSLTAFQQFDHREPNYTRLRPDQERLVVLDDFDAEWKKRIAHLHRLFDPSRSPNTLRLQLHEIRQIEFLSHSVDMDQIAREIQTLPDTPLTHLARGGRDIARGIARVVTAPARQGGIRDLEQRWRQRPEEMDRDEERERAREEQQRRNEDARNSRRPT